MFIGSNNAMVKAYLILLLSILTTFAGAQESYNVLFIGNSYTGANNLPQLVEDVALSAGDTLNQDSNTPGGYTLFGHAGNITSYNKIAEGIWDYVVIQGQSQEPITQSGDFQHGANLLREYVKTHNPCAVVMSYMTWGRENGNATNCPVFPEMCTYMGMDTTLRNQYIQMTDILSGETAPVSVVWRYLRENHPTIDLYSSDGSHPSAAGSYAAACTFYASLFKKDPTLISYDFGLSPAIAETIRLAAKTIVFDDLSTWDFKKLPVADIFTYMGAGETTVEYGVFNPLGLIQSYHWDFGDGTTDTVQSGVHTYDANGTYTIQLTITTCDLDGIHTSTDDTTFQICTHTPTVTAAAPWTCVNNDTLWTQPADAYQWHVGGVPIPAETDSILVDPVQYTSEANSWISVLSTQNGCSEMSLGHSVVPPWTGYSFDLTGEPCITDTLLLSVQHLFDPLSGSEQILWFQDGNQLTSWQNEDTLLITEEGIYQGIMLEAFPNCPYDTVFSSIVVVDCFSVDVIDIEEDTELASIKLYPNPASSQLYIDSKMNWDEARVFDLLGQQLNVTQSKSAIRLDQLNKGMYVLSVYSNGVRVATQPFLKQ